MDRYICIHGHFYQPPRENAWLETIELQDSAYPYHDWNERITAECYAPNSASRLFDSSGKIIKIVNNYANISFNFGPTLLAWMAATDPKLVGKIVEADKLSAGSFSGHGSAIAQVYNHMILPLANKRDKRTQVLWGIKDFEKRFGRFPEGMWLPETAVDAETLETLAESGIKFTILAPRQAKRIRKITEQDGWEEVNDSTIDPTRGYVTILPSGRTINLFFYDGPISQDLGFGDLLNSGENFAKRLLSAFNEERDWPQLVHIATDGETYGHHHHFGERALSYCLHYIESNNLAKVTNYGEYLEKNPPTYVAGIFDNSSWSCIHGVERWRNDCGCNTGMHPGWNQLWRKPLREAFDWLRDKLIPLYEQVASVYLKDPWSARDDYIGIILDRAPDNVSRFLDKHAAKALSDTEIVKVLKLLELQRHALLMYTSCGWFFDEISGIETTQVMQYACRAIQLAEELFDVSLEKNFLEILAKAPTNIPQYENGAKIYKMFVKPAMVDLMRVGAHYAISSLFRDYADVDRIYCYTARREFGDHTAAGKLKGYIGRVRIISEITWDQRLMSFTALDIDLQNIYAGLRDFVNEAVFSVMQQEMNEAIAKGDIAEIIKLLDKHFGTYRYSLRHLFKDEQRSIMGKMLEAMHKRVEDSFRHIFEDSYAYINLLKQLGMPYPEALYIPARYTVNDELHNALQEKELNTDRIKDLLDQAQRLSIEVEKPRIGFAASIRINTSMQQLEANPENNALLEKIETALKLFNSLDLGLELWNLWSAQNIYFTIDQKMCKSMSERAGRGDEAAQKWGALFCSIGEQLNIKVD